MIYLVYKDVHGYEAWAERLRPEGEYGERSYAVYADPQGTETIGHARNHNAAYMVAHGWAHEHKAHEDARRGWIAIEP